MDGTVVFAGGYSMAMVLAAVGIDRVGVISTRRRPGGHTESALPWPHTGSIALHTVVAAVASFAGVALAGVVAVLHHSAADLAVLAVPLAIGVATLARMANQVQAALRD